MLSRRTLLLADDSPTVQKVVSLTFADEGMRVLTASGGREALAALGETVPDVLLADVHMPAPGGYELCARVKRDPRTAGVPVLLLVGTFETFDEAEARRVGADGVLTKPFQSIRELVSRVGGLIGGHPEQNKAAAPARAADTHARAEADEAAAAAHERPAHASSADVRPAPVFAGLDADDDGIESVPADDYVAAGRAHAEDAAEFVAARAPFAPEAAEAPFARAEAGVGGSGRAVEAAGGVSGAPTFGGGVRAAGGYPAPRFVAPQAESGFAARATQPAADDSLLELGDLVSARTGDAADLDDLILDIEDDGDAPDARVEASDSAEAPGVFDAEAVAVSGAGESAPAGAGISPANLSSAWSDAPSVEVPPARAAFAEPVVDESAADESFEVEAETAVGAAVGTDDAPPAADAAMPAQVARPEVAEPRAHAADAPASASEFSPELVDAVARRVVELMSDAAVREIAWEVVPELAERLIRDRLARENTRTA